MSKIHGMQALNLEMPERVPRTEYSVLGHPELLTRVTGIPVTKDASPDVWRQAQRAFLKAWNFDFMWNTDIAHSIFGEYYTDMGHAVYAAGGTDFSAAKESKFKDEDDVLAFDPWEAFGERKEEEIIAFLNQEYARGCDFWDDAVNMNGIYVTCMSGLIDLFGWDLLLTAAGVDPKGFGETANRYAQCGFHGFVLEPGTDMEYIAHKYGKTHAFVGNADTRILLMGDREDIYKEVKRCMDIGKNCPGFFMAVGNHIPANTPVDHALWYNEFYEELSRR